jgi:dihydrofolate reductase
MSKLIVSEDVSVDGVFQDNGGADEIERGGWATSFDRGEEGDKFKMDELAAGGAQLLGRRTYDLFVAAWPKIKDELGAHEYMNGMAKYVVSSTLKDPEWNNTTVLEGDLAEGVKKLKDEIDGDILVYGSGQLVGTLLDEGLIDELRLMVYPAIVGEGKRLFGAQSDLSTFKLTDSKRLGPEGVIVLTYEPVA